jgi:hypothetical protein
MNKQAWYVSYKDEAGKVWFVCECKTREQAEAYAEYTKRDHGNARVTKTRPYVNTGRR